MLRLFFVDHIVVGGGIVGLATAYQILKKNPRTSLWVFEKEPTISTHQSGRNSGVIHSGIYYKPNSLKATNCREGKRTLEEFCKDTNVPFNKIGKLIVATTKEEEGRLQNLFERGKQNGIDCKLLTQQEMLQIEPHVSGLCAIHVPETGIVDYRRVCKSLKTKIREMGGLIFAPEELIGLVDGRAVTRYKNKLWYNEFQSLVNCGGLYADKIARLCGYEPDIQIIPFRGEYYTLSADACGLVKGLIYPVPDPAFPFLGVHFTRMINGGVECGPNAVLALGRESYKKYQINIKELWEMLKFPGFWKLSKYWKMGCWESLRSSSKTLYTRELKRLVPLIEKFHLISNRPAGIRAQAVGRDGNLIDDFLIRKVGNVVHVLNTPSPAATACLQIGKHISELI